MVWKQNLLLKAFVISLLIHIGGISIFSLILPVSIREIEPVEVSLLPTSNIPSPEKTYVVKNISPEIPKVSPKTEKIAIEKIRKDILKFSSEETIGASRIITPPEILSTRFELPDVKMPDIIPFGKTDTYSENRASISDVEIEGPAGNRSLIYKEPVEYPEWAIEKALEGNIRIKFWVAPDGKIILTNLITSSGYPELDLYAEQKFRKWLFEPIQTDKQAWGLITFRFYLK
ncbi:MAG: TonB family protein [bacterium]|nr:TonB family protein [bacterium]